MALSRDGEGDLRFRPHPYRMRWPFESHSFHKINPIRKDGVYFMGWILGFEPTTFRATI